VRSMTLSAIKICSGQCHCIHGCTVQSNDAIPIANLFSNPTPNVHKMTPPKKVLLEGQPGIGKSTVAKEIFNQWPHGNLWPHSREEPALPTLVASIIHNDSLPGAQMLVCSRPTEHLLMTVFNHVVQLCGFTNDRVHDYVQKTSKGKENFIMKCLDANTNLRELCHNPQQCGLVYAILCMLSQQMRSC